jgi:hypothetical protein
MDRFTGAWTPALVTAEADRLFPTITIGLMFPSAAWPIAVDGGSFRRLPEGVTHVLLSVP